MSLAISVSSSLWPIVSDAKPFRVDCFHDAAGIERAAKNFETARSKIFAKIDQFHFETAIRFVAAVSADRFAISQPIERRLDVDLARGFENRREHSFGQRKNVVRFNERRFDVDLGKFRLAIGAQVFVAKTFRDLEIFFDAGDHEQLFVLLRRLRQRVEFARREPARHQKIARAFRRALERIGVSISR